MVEQSSAQERRVLVTGGAGYIGSHTVIELLAAGWQVEVLDNFDNSSPEALRRVERLQASVFHSMRSTCSTRRLCAVFLPTVDLPRSSILLV